MRVETVSEAPLSLGEDGALAILQANQTTFRQHRWGTSKEPEDKEHCFASSCPQGV